MKIRCKSKSKEEKKDKQEKNETLTRNGQKERKEGQKDES